MNRVLPLALAMLAGCSGMVNDQFNVRHDGAVLPVLVRGNLDDSDTLILYETGGPWGGGIEEAVTDYQHFKTTLEPHVAVAYYDRRGYGNAYGNYRPDDISVDHYVADQDAILWTLQERYEPSRIVLMGHSWGGFITGRSLIDRGSSGIDAWISVSGAVVTGGDDAYVPYRRDMVCRVATDQSWDDVMDWCEANPSVDPESEEKEELWAYLERVYELAGDPPIRTGPLLAAVFGSSYNITDSLLTPNEISLPVHQETREMDLLSELEGVEVPTLFVAGEYDDIIPTEVSEAAAAIVPGAEVVEIAEAGHYVSWPDPEPLGAEVRAFLDL